MVAHRVLLIDDNQIFGSQVVAAFADADISATWVTRSSAALPLLSSEATRPELIIVDLVRPASAGRWLIDHLHLQRMQNQAGGRREALVLALVPVIGTYHDLPEGIEVQVKPIFPSQVVASARRLLGLTAASGAPPAPMVVHDLPSSPIAPPPASPLSLPPAMPIDQAVTQQLGRGPQTEAKSPPPSEPQAIDSFEEISDFGPADTLLAPSSIEELARAMTSGSSGHPALRIEDELFDGPGVRVPDFEFGPAHEEATSPRTPVPGRSRTRPQWNAIADRPLVDVADELAAAAPLSSLDEELHENAETEPLSRTASVPAVHTSPELPAAAGLMGDLSVIPLIDVIALLARQGQSGLFYIAADAPADELAARWTVCFQKGRIDLCTATGLSTQDNDLRIGRFILEAAALSHAQIDEIEQRRQVSAASSDRDEADLLGLWLCKEGLLDHDELRQALSRQTTELVYAALRLGHGSFYFQPHAELPPAAASAELGGALGLDTEALLLEGYRRARDFHFLDRDADEKAVYISTAPTSVPPSAQQALRDLGLSPSEVMVLGFCNGRLTLAEIAKESHLPPLEVARTIHRLSSLRLCRRRLPAQLAS